MNEHNDKIACNFYWFEGLMAMQYLIHEMERSLHVYI
jgi:hypothetical protein